MKAFFCLLLACCSLAAAEQTPLPDDLPFKKSLTLTSILLYNAPLEDTKMVEELSTKMKNYAVLESQAIDIIAPLIATRKALKETVKNTVFQNEQDLQLTIEKLQKDTDENTAHNLQELQRDRLIQFDETGAPIASSDLYMPILKAASGYQEQQAALKKHPLFNALEHARKELKPCMDSFLRIRYKSIEQLQKEFNSPIESVTMYLDAMHNR